jgi:hypothetical protein
VTPADQLSLRNRPHHDLACEQGVDDSNPSFCVVSADFGVPAADGAVWYALISGSHANDSRIRTLSRDFAQSKPVPCGYVFNTRRNRYLMPEELPVRLAHRVKDLDNLPDKLHEMPSIEKVKTWYAQSFEVSPCIGGLVTRRN